MSNSCIPFPQSPRWPGEGDLDAEPILNGVPHAPEESVFYPPGAQLEIIGIVARDLKQYQAANSKTQKQKVLKQRAEELLRNPELLESYFETVEDLSRFYGEKDTQDINQNLQSHLKQYAQEFGLYSRETLAYWLRSAVRSNLHGELAHSVLVGLFLNCSDAEQTVNFLHELCMVILESEDPEIVKFGIGLVCFADPAVPTKSLQCWHYLAGGLSNDDAILSKRMDVGAVQLFIGQRVIPEQRAQLESSLSELWKHPRTIALIDRLADSNLKRLRQLARFWDYKPEDSSLGEGFYHYPTEILSEWPFTMIAQDAGSLRVALNEYASQEEGHIIPIWLPQVGSSVVEYSDRLAGTVLYYLQTPCQYPNPLETREAIAALYYLKPELSERQASALNMHARDLRNKIFEDKTHFLTERGDRLKIRDPELRALGFKSITFARGENNHTTVVSVEAGNYSFRFELDRDFNFKEFGGRRGFPVAQARRGFFEVFVLGHLYELLCDNKIVACYAGASKEDAGSATRAFYGRRPSLVNLPAGKGFTPEQRELCMQSENGFDLAAHNRELGRTRETGQKTYQKGVKTDQNGNGHKPLVLVAPRASKRIRRLLHWFASPEAPPTASAVIEQQESD